MAQLLVRRLDDDLVNALKQRAAKNGRSAEAEHREILRQALTQNAADMNFKEFLLTIPPLVEGEEENFGVRRDEDFPRDATL